MEQNPFAPAFETLPDILPVFPLQSAFLLPSGFLPLNIFEPRYKAMIEDALASDRLIGMIQPVEGDTAHPALRAVGCAGKIVEFSETPDGRYLIKLSGVYRFRVAEEIEMAKPYRCVRPDWSAYKDDINAHKSLNLDRGKLCAMLGAYFEKQGMSCDWDMVEGVTDGKLITCLSMVCPFSAAERQALLEAPCFRTRAEMFTAILERALHELPQKACH